MFRRDLAQRFGLNILLRAGIGILDAIGQKRRRRAIPRVPDPGQPACGARIDPARIFKEARQLVVVIALHDLPVPPLRQPFHQMVDDGGRLGATVDQVAQMDDMRILAAILRDQVMGLAKRVHPAMDVADGIDGLEGGLGRHREPSVGTGKSDSKRAEMARARRICRRAPSSRAMPDQTSKRNARACRNLPVFCKAARTSGDSASSR